MEDAPPLLMHAQCHNDANKAVNVSIGNAKSNRRFAHIPPNPLKSLDMGFVKSESSPLQFIEYKGLIEMTEPREVMYIYG